MARGSMRSTGRAAAAAMTASSWPSLRSVPYVSSVAKAASRPLIRCSRSSRGSTMLAYALSAYVAASASYAARRGASIGRAGRLRSLIPARLRARSAPRAWRPCDAHSLSARSSRLASAPAHPGSPEPVAGHGASASGPVDGSHRALPGGRDLAQLDRLGGRSDEDPTLLRPQLTGRQRRRVDGLHRTELHPLVPERRPGTGG